MYHDLTDEPSSAIVLAEDNHRRLTTAVDCATGYSMGREMQNASKTGDLDEFANAGKHWQVVWLSYRAMFLSTYISRISFFRLRSQYNTIPDKKKFSKR